MVPIRASVEDIQKLLGYLGKQIGWVDQATMQKALGTIDDRKISAIVEFGLILRDGSNLRMTERGKLFNSDAQAALRETLASVDLYKATLEWVHYGASSEVTAAEVGQYWESTHRDTLGGLKGSTLLSGAVIFGRVVDGAGLGTFLVGRGGKETRMTFNLAAVDAFVNGTPPAAAPVAPADEVGESDAAVDTSPAPTPDAPTSGTPLSTGTQTLPAPSQAPTLSVSTSPSVHVNVEIHIAADATADTVREIFKNMARYVLDKHIADDGD